VKEEKMQVLENKKKFRAFWFWPILAGGLSLVILTSFLGFPTGRFGEAFVLLLQKYLGRAALLAWAVLTLMTLFREFKGEERIKKQVLWLSVFLMGLSFSTLESQLFHDNHFPLKGGFFGLFTSGHLREAFGLLAPLVSLSVFCLALMAWGGKGFQEGFQRSVFRGFQALRRGFFHLLRKEEEEPLHGEDGGQEEVSIPENKKSFRNKALDIEELLLKKEAALRKKQEQMQQEEKSDESVSASARNTLEEKSSLETLEVSVPSPLEKEKPVSEEPVEEAKEDGKPAAQLSLKRNRKKNKKKKMPKISRTPGAYSLPVIDFLSPAEQDDTTVDELKKINESAKALQEALKHFNLDIQVVGIQQGPVITQYEIELAPGIKVSRVMNLQNDIAMALKARSVRILAPIPGKSTVGIEVPNPVRRSVCLRELIENGSSDVEKMALPSFIGRNIFGDPVCYDISRMPHLLIAGSTGAGKSVGINCLIVSLLMCRSPDEVKLILVDPKQVELNFYKGIPHLASPVVTDMKKVPGILDWAVRKMEERYDLLARVGVRDIFSFNELGEEGVHERLGLTEEEKDLVDTYMPRVVIVIDELADLMMLSSAAKEVEANIQRLAQKSRAVGIHVVLDTQRPSVDVITGVIKANMTCRMAFMVNSATDSRTILDRKGAESLLGQGDLLFKDPSRSDLQRLQGAFISEEEVKNIVNFWKDQGEPEYIDDLINPNRSGDDLDPRQKDELYDKAVRLVLESRRGSTTFIQRMLGVGYTRASRLIELMEMEGVVGPHKGSVSRDILYTLEEYEAALEAEVNETSEEEFVEEELEESEDETEDGEERRSPKSFHLK
jgi:S-DNA-T family DNA segregation ATPase FtsK/SpoIIIE